MKVAIVVYHEHTRHVLCGYESYYCYEEAEDNSEQLRDLEMCSEPLAIQRATYLSSLYEVEVRYVPFVNHRTHYCCQTSNSHLGIIKGNVNLNEDTVTAIRRELEEEVGIIVQADRLTQCIHLSRQPRPTKIFLLPVSNDESIAIMHHVHELRKRHYGEMFNIAFRELVEGYPYNFITKQLSKWVLYNTLPCIKTPVSPLQFTPLLPLTTYEERTYEHDFIHEPPFVWGATRSSLLPLPPRTNDGSKNEMYLKATY